MKKYILIVLLSIFGKNAFSNQPLVRNFSRLNYKAGTQNWGIAQNESNAMFFANNDGLMEFDGKNWTNYPIKNGTNVRSILSTKDGRYYASTFNEYGYFEKQKNGRMNYTSLIKPNESYPVSSNELYNIIQGDNKIYFQSQRFINQYNGDSLVRLPFSGRIDYSAFVHNIYFISSVKSGIFMLSGNIFVRLPGSELLINKKVCAILPFKDKKILFVTSFDGVYIFDGFNITAYKTGIEDFLEKNQVFCATTNGKQIVYGTVQRGIAVQNTENDNVIYINTFSGLQNNTILSAAFDNQQNLWLGLDNGIDYVMLNCPIRNMFGTNNLYGAGYASVLKNNTLYLGTNQGLYTTSYPIDNNSIPLQLKLVKGMEGQVWCLDEIDNTLFCGDDKGAFIINQNNIEQLPALTGTWSFKQLIQHPDMILGCSYQGLFIMKKQADKWQFSNFIKGRFTESSPMFEEDTDGTLWLSHWQKGLFHLYLNNSMDSIIRVDLFDSKRGLPSNQNNTVFKIDNKLIFSSERGFYFYNKQKNKMEPFEVWNKLFNSVPSYIRLHEAKNGDIWCTSGRFVGLVKKNANKTYTMDSLTYRILQPKIISGFENFDFIDDNNLILSTEDGFSWIDTQKQNKIKSTFKVFIKNVIITDNKSRPLTNSPLTDKQSLLNKFKHNQNSLRIEFIAPEYRNDGLVQYSYKLENYDDNWSEFSSNTIKEYTQLPKGEYVFRVRAHDILESSEAVCSYSFTILPAWYETKIAISIYIIIFLILITGIIVLIEIRSKKGALEMKELKEKELIEQKTLYEADTSAKKKEIKELKNQQLQYELRHKSQELASSTMNIIRKNEMLFEIIDNISKTTHDLKSNTDNGIIINRLNKMERNIKENIENDNNWKRFEENFDLVYENYLKRLSETYSELTVSDKKLCAYLKMDLSSKDIAPLLNMTVRSIEMNRYRLRKKMNLDRDINLGEFLQRF